MLFLEKNFRVLFGTGYFLLIAVVIGLLSASAFAQTETTVAQSGIMRTDAQEAVKPNSSQPFVADLMGIKIGMTRDEVKDKLGKPKIDDADGFYYELSDDKIAQIRLDADKKVRVIVVTYRDGSQDAPKVEDVFGSEMQVAAQPDGSLYNLVRYPEAGFWIAYSRTAGDKPTILISMQKL